MRSLALTIRTNRVARLFGFFVGVIGLVFGISSLVAAEQLPSRSVQLSSASAAATGVTYAFEFTVNAAAGAFVIDFCSNSPQAGSPCTAPAGMTAENATITTPGYAKVGGDANTLAVTSTIAAAGTATFTIDGVTNPSASGLVYARIMTYDTPANAQAYTSENLGAGSIDGGTVAFSVTDTIGVTGSVMESVTFCVSGVQIGANCSGVQRPVLRLGETLGDVVALTPSNVSEGAIYAQISTNAATGVTVNLKSSAAGCGGLMRAGNPEACDIGPALEQGITEGQAKFGVKVTPAADTGTSPNGMLRAAGGSIYGPLRFSLNYAIGNASGITSTFGDPFLDTNGAPANNKNVALTFGASVSNETPAGSYSADLSLIATGKF